MTLCNSESSALVDPSTRGCRSSPHLGGTHSRARAIEDELVSQKAKSSAPACASTYLEENHRDRRAAPRVLTNCKRRLNFAAAWICCNGDPTGHVSGVIITFRGAHRTWHRTMRCQRSRSWKVTASKPRRRGDVDSASCSLLPAFFAARHAPVQRVWTHRDINRCHRDGGPRGRDLGDPAGTRAAWSAAVDPQ